jgi:serine protease AprX
MATPIFKPNYPFDGDGRHALLSTPARTGALPDYTGRNVTIAFIDSGFYPHPDLDGRILLHVDASTNHIVEQQNDFTVDDMSWHGQITSVIGCGDGRTSQENYRAIASESQLVLVRVSTPKGHVKETDILRGLRWVADTHRRLNIRIVNVSVGGDAVCNDPDYLLHKVVRRLTDDGVVVVVAAGNRPVRHLLPPASAPEAVVVGGLDDQNTLDRSKWRLYHHNYGNAHDGSLKPDLLAPAEWIVSPILPGTSVEREARWLAALLDLPPEKQLKKLLREGYADLGITRKAALSPDEKLYAKLQKRIHVHKIIDAHHQYVDGTSVATPIVTSVIAQMLEANPRLTPRQIRDILTATAVPLDQFSTDRQGGGVLNATEAVKAAQLS